MSHMNFGKKNLSWDYSFDLRFCKSLTTCGYVWVKLYITHSHLRGWSIKQTNESLKVGRKPLGEESDRERVDLGNVTAANMSDIFVLKIKKMTSFVILLIASLIFSFIRHHILCNTNDKQEKQFLVIARLLVR